MVTEVGHLQDWLHSPWRLHCSESIGDSTGMRQIKWLWRLSWPGGFPHSISHIDGYPHPVPQIDEWGDLLPRFYEGENDNPVDHVQNFML
jgi:hypothetical protein